MDGKKIAFLRQPGAGGTPRSPLSEPESTWAVVVADTEPAAGKSALDTEVVTALTSGEPPVDAILRNPNGISLRWAADDAGVFVPDGWPHLPLHHPGPGSRPRCHPGSFMVEQFALTPDRRVIVYNANTGADRTDVDRRHLSVDRWRNADATDEWHGHRMESGPTCRRSNRDS
jgi:hypothetical protein